MTTEQKRLFQEQVENDTLKIPWGHVFTITVVHFSDTQIALVLGWLTDKNYLCRAKFNPVMISCAIIKFPNIFVPISILFSYPENDKITKIIFIHCKTRRLSSKENWETNRKAGSHQMISKKSSDCCLTAVVSNLSPSSEHQPFVISSQGLTLEMSAFLWYQIFIW